MKQIISAFGVLFMLLLHIFAGTALLTAAGDVAAAKEYKAGVIAEIENSNFNQNVMQSCVDEAKRNGYELAITDCMYDARYDIRTAKVALQYQYQIPIFEITEVRTTYGIAR